MNHKKVLLVDDDPDDQLIFMDALNEISTGIECIIANNGSEALTQLKTLVPSPSLIFLDLNMPLINGFECLDRIKQDSLLKKIPVIIVTTSDSLVDEKRTKESGAAIYITKTPDFNLLKTQLLQVLETDFLTSETNK